MQLRFNKELVQNFFKELQGLLIPLVPAVDNYSNEKHILLRFNQQAELMSYLDQM